MGTKHAVILCIAAAAAPAAADDHAPSSLRMRDPGALRTRPSPALLGRRVAQLPPAPEPEDPAASRPVPPPAEDDGKIEVISVTESPIEHKLFIDRAPVSVVTRADLAASGRATLGDILQSLPMQANAGNAQVNAGGDGMTRISLRGLGAPRTLVLINGRRIVNGGPGADAAVDINAIPLPVIERVEILKDGASAIYGADAVGGVVNVITRPKFNGTDISLLTSTSQRGDSTEYDVGLVTGFATRDKRTYLVLSGGFQRHAPVLAGDRAFSTFQKSYDFASKTETRNASLAVPAGRLDVSSIGIGGVPVGARPPGCTSDVCKRDGNGDWTDFVEPRDVYNEAPENYLYTPSSRYNLFATGGKRLNDHTASFVEVLYLRRNNDRQLSPAAFVADSPISKDSIYNPFGGDILDYRRRMTELGPRQYLDTGSLFRLVLGITGDVPPSLGVLKDWSYEVSYNYGASYANAATTGQLLKPKVADALGPSMLDADGVPICVRVPGDPTTKIVYIVDGIGIIPCVPVDWLAPAGSIPREQLENLTFRDAGSGINSMGTLLASASGTIAELPNQGDISLSFGGDYRYEVGYFVPPSVAFVGYTTDNASGATSARFKIFEGFSELSIVPLSGHHVAKRVQIDLGVRGLYHDRFGSSFTYKAGGLFRTVHGIAVRGTYATAFRAPSLSDLFAGRSQRTPSAEDPCDTKPPSVGQGTKTLDPMVQAQCTAQGVPLDSKFATSQQLSLIGGNRELEAETAATTTIGVVVEPPQLKGLALSADYWHIDIDNAIETLGVQTIFANCYDRGVQSYCDQIHRDPITHRISPVDQALQNVIHTTTSGIDVALRYDTKLADLGRVRTGFEAQYLLRYDLDTSLQVIHGVGFYDLGVYPRFKANLSSNWSHPGGASGGFALRYVGAYEECAANNCNNDNNLAITARDVGRYFKLDLFGGYDFRSGIGKTSVQLGINNLLDATPPIVYNATAANSDAATYDFVGRMVYLRLSQLF
jgi:iron complex outermembrane recepter protein